jgi:tetraprenyl-beta-curcumene synthase
MMTEECLQTSGWALEYFSRIRPAVRRELAVVERRARAVEEPGARRLALDSIIHKQFHCEGGAVLTGGAPGLVRLVVAYQTLCDYLDSITDRGPAASGDTIRRLHGFLPAALDPDLPVPDGWADHPWDDGGYAAWLVARSREALRELPGWAAVRDSVRWLQDRYVDLQSLKHAPDSHLRGVRQAAWFAQHQRPEWSLAWWEWAAATGSTLGIFALAAEARAPAPDADRVEGLFRTYFPWMGGLHILLDYFIDQEEDRMGGDFNFIRCYDSVETAVQGITRLYDRAVQEAGRLSDAPFHRYLARGLLGFYLSDRKVSGELTAPARRLLSVGGSVSRGIWALARVGRAP